MTCMTEHVFLFIFKLYVLFLFLATIFGHHRKHPHLSRVTGELSVSSSYVYLTLYYLNTEIQHLLYPRNFGEGRWAVSWMLLHRNMVCIGCDGCLKQTRCTRFQALLITIGRIYRKQAGKASQQLIQTVCINGRIGNAPFQASEVFIRQACV
jgi:hypothetical protein